MEVLIFPLPARKSKSASVTAFTVVAIVSDVRKKTEMNIDSFMG